MFELCMENLESYTFRKKDVLAFVAEKTGVMLTNEGLVPIADDVLIMVSLKARPGHDFGDDRNWDKRLREWNDITQIRVKDKIYTIAWPENTNDLGEFVEENLNQRSYVGYWDDEQVLVIIISREKVRPEDWGFSLKALGQDYYVRKGYSEEDLDKKKGVRL